MSYFNQHIGYPQGLLQSRARIERGNFALIPVEGLVKNVIPGFNLCDVTILSSPKLGADFIDYYVTIHPGGGHKGFGDEEIESFLYVIEGEIKVMVGDEEQWLKSGGYVYTPAGMLLAFESVSTKEVKGFLYKRRYRQIEGYGSRLVIGNALDIPFTNYEGMINVGIKDLLPKDLGFDMNFHILSFEPGASHGYIETHIQEHGALILTGEGMYNLDNHWMPVEKGDYIFMGPYSLQAAYGIGQENFSYIYSKDCNRDAEI